MLRLRWQASCTQVQRCASRSSPIHLAPQPSGTTSDPVSSSQQLKKRFAGRQEAQEAESEAKETGAFLPFPVRRTETDERKGAGTVEDVDKLSRRQVKVTKEHNEECRRLLTLMGIPWVEVRFLLSRFPAALADDLVPRPRPKLRRSALSFAGVVLYVFRTSPPSPSSRVGR